MNIKIIIDKDKVGYQYPDHGSGLEAVSLLVDSNLDGVNMTITPREAGYFQQINFDADEWSAVVTPLSEEESAGLQPVSIPVSGEIGPVFEVPPQSIEPENGVTINECTRQRSILSISGQEDLKAKLKAHLISNNHGIDRAEALSQEVSEWFFNDTTLNQFLQKYFDTPTELRHDIAAAIEIKDNQTERREVVTIPLFPPLELLLDKQRKQQPQVFVPRIPEAQKVFSGRKPTKNELRTETKTGVIDGKKYRVDQQVWDYGGRVCSYPLEVLREAYYLPGQYPATAQKTFDIAVRSAAMQRIFDNPLNIHNNKVESYYVDIPMKLFYELTECKDRVDCRKAVINDLVTIRNTNNHFTSDNGDGYDFSLISSVITPARRSRANTENKDSFPSYAIGRPRYGYIRVIFGPEYSAAVETAWNCREHRQRMLDDPGFYLIDCNRYRYAYNMGRFLYRFFGERIDAKKRKNVYNDTISVHALLDNLKFWITPREYQGNPRAWKQNILKPFLSNLEELVRVGVLYGHRLRWHNIEKDVPLPKDWETFVDMNLDFYVKKWESNATPIVLEPIPLGSDFGQWQNFGKYAIGYRDVKPGKIGKERVSKKSEKTT